MKKWNALKEVVKNTFSSKKWHLSEKVLRISGRNKWHLLAVAEVRGDLGSLENLTLLSASKT